MQREADMPTGRITKNRRNWHSGPSMWKEWYLFYAVRIIFSKPYNVPGTVPSAPLSTVSFTWAEHLLEVIQGPRRGRSLGSREHTFAPTLDCCPVPQYREWGVPGQLLIPCILTTLRSRNHPAVWGAERPAEFPQPRGSGQGWKPCARLQGQSCTVSTTASCQVCSINIGLSVLKHFPKDRSSSKNH